MDVESVESMKRMEEVPLTGLGESELERLVRDAPGLPPTEDPTKPFIF